MECYERATAETRVRVCLGRGRGSYRGATGIPFFDHMLETLVKYSRLDMELEVEVLKSVDDHHVVEDVGIAMGRALDALLGERRNLKRFAHAIIPMDDALVAAAVDLARRPYFLIRGYKPRRPEIGGLALENVPHFLRTLAFEARFTLHIIVFHGENDHHVTEAVFKATGFALGEAMEGGDSPSTKETLL